MPTARTRRSAAEPRTRPTRAHRTGSEWRHNTNRNQAYSSRKSVRETGTISRLHANKDELLVVLDRPEVPLNTNGSERDLRPQVTKRKVSGGTQSDQGRDGRDVFASLLLTCAKLSVSFWDYLGHRLGVFGVDAPYLPDLVRTRSATA